MKIELLAAFFAAAFVLTPAAARADDDLGCEAGYHPQERVAHGEKRWGCVGETKTCADGYKGEELGRQKIFACVRYQNLGTKCEGRAVGMVTNGKLMCHDPASLPPDYDHHKEKAGDNSYRFVSNLACPKGYRFGKAWVKQIVCAGPKTFSCGDGYAGVGLDTTHPYCASVQPLEKTGTCPSGGHPSYKDAAGGWHCVEPDSDKCPKDRHYHIGILTGENAFRCLFYSET
jgi:hypothetical protein